MDEKCPECGGPGEAMTTGKVRCASCGNKWKPDTGGEFGGNGGLSF